MAAIGPAVMGRLPDKDYHSSTKWLSSPVPGQRTQPDLDPYRLLACREKNSLIYTKNSGLIPKVSQKSKTLAQEFSDTVTVTILDGYAVNSVPYSSI